MNWLTIKKHSLDAGASISKPYFTADKFDRQHPAAMNPKIFFEFLQYRKILAFVFVEAGSMYDLLKNIEAHQGKMNVLFASKVHVMNG